MARLPRPTWPPECPLLPAPWLGGRCWKLFRGLLWILSLLLLPGHDASTEQPGLAGALHSDIYLPLSLMLRSSLASVSSPILRSQGNWRNGLSALLRETRATRVPEGPCIMLPGLITFPGLLRLQRVTLTSSLLWVSPALGTLCQHLHPPQDPFRKLQEVSIGVA